MNSGEASKTATSGVCAAPTNIFAIVAIPARRVSISDALWLSKSRRRLSKLPCSNRDASISSGALCIIDASRVADRLTMINGRSQLERTEFL
jgi:hypothetical protein